MAFRFVHSGDLHLDSPFVGLTTEAPPNVATALRESTISAWNNIIELALTEEADFLLVAGDAFERANRTLRGQLVFRDGLARLAEANIPSFIVTGNHDPLDGWEPSVSWPDLVHRFPAHDITSKPVMRESEEIARVYGISYHQRDITTNLAKQFTREPDTPFAIGLLHANVGGIEGYANYAPCSRKDLREAGMDYWALGHIHRHRVLQKNKPTIVYCGNPQGRDPGEPEPRGCYLVTVDDNGRVHPEFRAMDVVRWQLLDVPIVDIESDDELVDAVVAAAADESRAEPGRSVVVRVTLTGRGPLHASLAKSGYLEDVRVVAQERLGFTEPFAWIGALRDETRPAVNVETRRRTDDFVGDLLRRLHATRGRLGVEVADDAADVEGVPSSADIEETLDELFATQRARSPLRDARPDDAQVAELLDEVEAILLDRLGDGG